MSRTHSTFLTAGIASSALFAGTTAFAAPVVDGTISPSDGYGAPVATYVDQNGDGGPNTVSTYFTYDANYVYGAVHLDSGTPSPFAANGAANIYVYSSGANTDLDTGAPGVYGDGNDIIAEGDNGYGYADPSGITGGVHYAYSPSTVNFVYNGTDTVEFSIARSILGNYDSFRFGGQLFSYDFHTGSEDAEPGAIVYVPEPASLGLLGVGGLTMLRRRRR